MKEYKVYFNNSTSTLVKADDVDIVNSYANTLLNFYHFGKDSNGEKTQGKLIVAQFALSEIVGWKEFSLTDYKY